MRVCVGPGAICGRGAPRRGQRQALKSFCRPRGPSPYPTRSCHGRHPSFRAEKATNIVPRRRAARRAASVTLRSTSGMSQ
jgi:hypothetical protein